MAWTCVIVVNSDRREREAAALLAALRSAHRRAGRPADAGVFLNRGSASRCTFLLSPEASAMAGDVLGHYGAMACERTPALDRYSPLRL